MRFLFFLAGLTALAVLTIPLVIGVAHWLLFALAMWALFALVRGPRPRRRYYPPSPRPPQWERARVREPIRPPNPPVRPHQAPPTLPLEVQLKSDQIRRKAETLER